MVRHDRDRIGADEHFFRICQSDGICMENRLFRGDCIGGIFVFSAFDQLKRQCSCGRNSITTTGQRLVRVHNEKNLSGVLDTGGGSVYKVDSTVW